MMMKLPQEFVLVGEDGLGTGRFGSRCRRRMMTLPFSHPQPGASPHPWKGFIPKGEPPIPLEL